MTGVYTVRPTGQSFVTGYFCQIGLINQLTGQIQNVSQIPHELLFYIKFDALSASVKVACFKTCVEIANFLPNINSF